MTHHIITELQQHERDIAHAKSCQITISNDLGSAFRRMRNGKNRSAGYIARELGINPHHLLKLEQGKYTIAAEFATKWLRVLETATTMKRGGMG